MKKKYYSVGAGFLAIGILAIITGIPLLSILKDMGGLFIGLGILATIIGIIALCAQYFNKSESSNTTQNTSKPISHTNYAKPFDYGDGVIDDDFNSKYDYINWFKQKIGELEHHVIALYGKHNWLEIDNEVIEAESLEIKYKENRISLHFFYQNIVIAIYPMRNEDEHIIQDILEYCDRDIENMSHVHAPGTPQLLITRKSIILENQGKLQEAIELCDYAIKNEILDQGKPFNIRKARLEKKLEKLRQHPISKTNE